MRATTRLRELLAAGPTLFVPGCYNALSARILEHVGFPAVYMTGYGTSMSLLGMPDAGLATMSEMHLNARYIAAAVSVPVIADADNGYGNAINVMRTVREYIQTGVAAIHIEDQVMPKRCGHVAGRRVIPLDEAVGKYRAADQVRRESDPDFVIIARTDTCRALGLEEAALRINAAADVGADLGLLFPRSLEEAEKAVKACRLPLVYVQSRGNRDGRPIIPRKELEQMGYVGCIEAQVVLCSALHYVRDMLKELRETGDYTGMTQKEWVASRQEVEDLISLTEFYEIEAQTVEARQKPDAATNNGKR